MYRLYHNKNVSGFVVEERVPDSEMWMRRSVFCLTPAGFGWCVLFLSSIPACLDQLCIVFFVLPCQRPWSCCRALP